MNQKHSKQLKCPICGQIFEAKKPGPFCSDRCRLLDLGSWASEKYRIPDSKALKFIDSEPEE